MYIQVANVTVEIPLNEGRYFGRGFRHKNYQQIGGDILGDVKGRVSIRALKNISFEIKPGERLAVIGKNGSGKSTLLRLLSGIYLPEVGSVHLCANTVPLLNLKLGMSPNETGYQNIYTRGLFLGMGRREIELKIESIAEMSELGHFLDLPIRTYSSGMLARLAFSISVHINADAIIIDEVIGTGDQKFLSQARKKVEELSRDSKIVVLASHSTRILQQLCNKGIVLKNGEIAFQGNIDKAITFYKNSEE